MAASRGKMGKTADLKAKGRAIIYQPLETVLACAVWSTFISKWWTENIFKFNTTIGFSWFA